MIIGFTGVLATRCDIGGRRANLKLYGVGGCRGAEQLKTIERLESP
jgi:hypothetical protein